MIKILIISHGNYAMEIIKSLESICGKKHIFEGTKDVMQFIQAGGFINKLYISNSNSINREILIDGVYVSSEDIETINILKGFSNIEVVYGIGN